jgi:O-antigen/teichoic acid export membrane protein
MNLIYLFFLLSLAFIAESIKYIFISIFYGIKKPKEAGLAKVIFASLLIFLLFYFDQRHILDFNISVLIFIFSNLIYLILSIYYYKKFIPKEKEEDKEGINNFYNSQISKRILKFGYPLFLSDIFILLNFKIGTVLLAGVSLNYSVYYHLSTSLIIYIVGIIGYPIKNNIQSYLAEFYEQNNLPQVKKTFFLIIQIIIFFLIPILITLYGLSPLFLKFLYSNYYSIDFINLFKIAIWGGSFYALNILLNNIIIAKGKTKMILFAQFFSSLFSITFIFIAIFLENILYAGIGFLGSNILSFMIFCVISKKYIHLTMKKMKFLPIVGFSFFSFIVFEIINIFLSNIFLSTVISLSMYIILILIFRIGSLGALKKIFKTLIE